MSRGFPVLIALGALLLAGVIGARLAERFRLPRLTGYLLSGLVIGAPGLGIVTAEVRPALLHVEQAVACVIAFSVGALVRWEHVRETARTVSWLVSCVLSVVILLCASTLALTLGWAVPGVLIEQPLLMTAVLSVTLAAVSPTVVAVVVGELRADGPLTRTVFSAVLLADVLLFLSLIALSVGAQNSVTELLRVLAGAIALGMALGLVLSRLMHPPLLLSLAAVVLLSQAVGQLIGPSSIAPMAAAIAAGIVSASGNVASPARRAKLTGLVLPIAATLLFALEGALLDLRMLGSLLAPASALVAVRAIGIWVGARLGSSAARADRNVRRWAFAGLLPQAGFALAMVSLLPALFPAFGELARALAVGVIALNELVMPPLLRHALAAAGEAESKPAPA